MRLIADLKLEANMYKELSELSIARPRLEENSPEHMPEQRPRSHSAPEEPQQRKPKRETRRYYGASRRRKQKRVKSPKNAEIPSTTPEPEPVTKNVPSPDQPSNRPGALTLLDLPPELHILIFTHLQRAPSTCLGLTCRAFYEIHWSQYQKANLGTMTFGISDHNRKFLHQLLREWMGEKYVYAPKMYTFKIRERTPRFLWEYEVAREVFGKLG